MRFFKIAVAAMLWSGEALAGQPPTEKREQKSIDIGSLVPTQQTSPRVTPERPDQATMTLKKFASCTVGRNKGAVEAAFRTVPGGGVGELPAELRATMENCLSYTARGVSNWVTMSLSADLMAGALAQELYVRSFRFVPALTPGKLRRSQLDGPLGVHGLLVFADCLAQRSPSEVDALLRSKAGDSGENEAFKAIAPNFTPCATEWGKITTNKLNLRAALADALYRRAAGLVEVPSTTGAH